MSKSVDLDGTYGTAAVAATNSNRYGYSVHAFSSQYYYEEDETACTAAQALGSPNVPEYGDYAEAWAASEPDNGEEFLDLAISTPIYDTSRTSPSARVTTTASSPKSH